MPSETRPLRRLRQHLTTGNIWLYVLSLLRKKPAYAYVLNERIEEKFSFRPSRIMSYVVLYKLEAEGLITSAFRARRKYYSLTSKGRQSLLSAKRELAQLAKKL